MSDATPAGDTTTTETEARWTPESEWGAGSTFGGRSILRVGHYANAFLGSKGEANRDRALACVNACEGIKPEAVPELLRVAKISQGVRRDEAWAIEAVTEWAVEHGYREDDALWLMEDNAIAKAVGGAA